MKSLAVYLAQFNNVVAICRGSEYLTLMPVEFPLRVLLGCTSPVNRLSVWRGPQFLAILIRLNRFRCLWPSLSFHFAIHRHYRRRLHHHYCRVVVIIIIIIIIVILGTEYYRIGWISKAVNWFWPTFMSWPTFSMKYVRIIMASRTARNLYNLS